MTPRLAGLIGVLCLSAGWMLGSVLSTPGVPLPPAAGGGPRPIGRSESPAPAARERLEVHRAPATAQPPAPSPGRNPFRFGATRPQAPLAADGEPEAAGDDAPVFRAPSVPAAPRYQLSGMATEGTGEAAVRTAIVRDAAGLHFVKQGDQLPDGATVTSVTESGITLALPGGGTMTLSLR